MFITNVLTIWVEALQQTFGPNYPDEKLAGIAITTEYPFKAVDYPGMWVTFAMQGAMKNVGIGHVEHTQDDQGQVHEVLRWEFGGQMEIVCAAMSNLERARLIDSVTTQIAIARPGLNAAGHLREHVTLNDLVPMNVVWESLIIGGFNENLGTPWGTDDVIYEATISIDIEGEVVVDPSTGVLIPLTAVNFDPVLAPAETPVLGTDGWN